MWGSDDFELHGLGYSQSWFGGRDGGEGVPQGAQKRGCGGTPALHPAQQTTDSPPTPPVGTSGSGAAAAASGAGTSHDGHLTF